MFVPARRCRNSPPGPGEDPTEMTARVFGQTSVSHGHASGRPSEPNGVLPFAAGILQDELRRRIAGEVHFDPVYRMLYSTDASNYQIDPIGVVIPASREDVLASIEIAARHGVPLLPRGGGSS